MYLLFTWIKVVVSEVVVPIPCTFVNSGVPYMQFYHKYGAQGLLHREEQLLWHKWHVVCQPIQAVCVDKTTWRLSLFYRYDTYAICTCPITLQWRNHVVLTFDLLKKLGSSKLGISFLVRTILRVRTTEFQIDYFDHLKLRTKFFLSGHTPWEIKSIVHSFL